MNLYIEPIFLNEKMVMNCAAYVFKGVAMESEISETKSSKNKGNLSLGFKFLSDLISPINASIDQEKDKSYAQRTARRYTLGGLHMTLIDALNDQNHIAKGKNVFHDGVRTKFIELDVILKPIDFYSIIEAIKISAPLIIQVLQNFGNNISPSIFNDDVKSELSKYEALITNVLSELENDYLKSGQLEMIMIEPDSGKQIGVVDIDVSDLDALSVKAKITDGRFKVIGRVSRQIKEGESISLVQRTIISSIISIIEKIVSATAASDAIKYKEGMLVARDYASQICQLNLPGPALRVMAMSICI
ncbi:hypothetical protein ACET8J_08510 [Aeromonas veronii]|uniref:DUF6414 family protein n=1 Tax=Aeromonas veronii TaxID=654 RepID=UPI00028073FD|nr:hypothetical protein [Aeromonas veronii]EKB23268.1 hypothetical protein HMPREF1170_01629 [Aeromonas veronii AMC35]